MSHFTKVKTKINNLNLLKQVLEDINIQFIESTAEQQISINCFNNEKIDVQMELKTGGKYSVGVVEAEDGTYEFVADWWGVEMYTELNEQQYTNKIIQKYAYNSVMDKVRAKGYDFVQEEVDDKNNIHVVLRKWE